jgi:hypothetical protein
MNVAKENITAKLALELCVAYYIKRWEDISHHHPHFSSEQELATVGDNSLSCEKRVHVIKEGLEDSHTELMNELVLSLQDAGWDVVKWA